MTPSDPAADRLEIIAALNNYAYGLDERRWEAWDLAFTDDAVIDFTPMGGKREAPAEMRARLSKPDPNWLFAQHPVANTVVSLEGDSASAYSDFRMELGRRSDVEGEIIRTSGGGAYQDTLVRAADGWRISRRLVYMKWKETRQVRDEVTLRTPLA